MSNNKWMKILAVIVAVIISLSMFASVSFASGNDLELCSTKPSVIYEKSADGSTVNIECYNIDEYPVAIVLVLYNQGKLVDVMTSYGSSSAVRFTPECQYDSERVMVWDSLEGMKPIVASDDIIYSQKSSCTIEGVVVETFHNGSLGKNEITYKFNKNMVYGDDAFKQFINNVCDGLNVCSMTFVLDDGITDITDYIQRSSVITFEKVSGGRYEIVNIAPGEGDLVEDVDLGDIDAVELATGSTAYDIIYYYPSPSSVRTSKYKIDVKADYYYNYSILGDGIEDFVSLITDTYGNILSNVDMEITLIENDGDNYFDAVMVKEYTYDIVKAINVDAGIIESNFYNIAIDLDDEYVSVVMKNADGEEITLDDIKKGDVIAYISDGDKTSDYEWLELINLGSNCVTGSVNEIDTSRGVVYVNDTEYGLAGVEYPNLGDEGTFYLTMTGKIFFVSLAVPESGDYAYVLNAAYNDADFTYAWQLLLLTQDNERVVYTVRDTFEFNGERISAKTDDCDELAAFAANEDWNGQDCDKGAHRVITFELDSRNRIKEINNVRDMSFTDEMYYKDSQVLYEYIANNAVIFDVSCVESSEYFATDISHLEDEEYYDGYLVTNGNGDVDCVVITYSTATLEGEPEEEITDMGYAYVLNAAYNDADFTTAWQLLLLTQDNERIVYTVGEEINFNDELVYAGARECAELERFASQKDWDGQDRDKGAHRVITYSVDSNEKIREINMVNSGWFADEEYNEATQVLGGAELTDNTVIFNITAPDFDDYFATDISHLEDEEHYDGYLVANENDDVDCVAITYSTATVEEEPEEEMPEEVIDMGYAYVLDTAYNDSDSTAFWQIKLLTQDNEIIIYTVGSTIKFDDEIVSTRTEDCDVLYDFVADEDWDGRDWGKGAYRVITYGVDSNEKIREINTVNCRYFTEKEFYADTQILGDAELADNTVVFNIAATKSDNYFATDISALMDCGIYTGAYFKNADGDYDCLIITAVNSSVDYTQDMVIVSSVGDLDLDETEQEAKKVEYYSASSKVCKYKLDMGTNVNFDNYEPPSFNFSPIISDFELIDITDITDVEVTPVETDGGDYSGVVKNKIDMPFTIVVPDIDIDACNGFYKTN